MDLNTIKILAKYEDIESKNVKFNKDNITLVREKNTGNIYVKKFIPVGDSSILKKIACMNIPHIPAYKEILDCDDGIVVIEQYIKGQTLDEYINEFRPQPKEIASMFVTICETLIPFHEANPHIIHRDIKPTNIIVNDMREVYLIDFDAARFYERDKSRDTVLIGTMDYAAPEQYGFSQSDARTDVYGIGATLKYYIKYAKDYVSFDDRDLQNLINISTKCTDIAPDRRYQTVGELRKVLSNVARQTMFTGYKGNMKYLPPGFRSFTWWKMLLAFLIYSSIFKGAEGYIKDVTTLYEKSVKCVVFVSVYILGVLLYTNYLDIWKHIPFIYNATTTKKRILYLSGVFLLIMIAFLLIEKTLLEIVC